MASTLRIRPRPNTTHRTNNNTHSNENHLETNSNVAVEEELLMAQRCFHGASNHNYYNTTSTTQEEEDRQKQRCKSLRILDFPEHVESIEDRAFYNSWSLRKLRIPPTIHSIGASAFANCWELRSIELPERIESSSSSGRSSSSTAGNLLLKLGLCFHNDSSVAIQDAAFNLCHSLRNIALPQSCDEEVPVTAFVGCAELKKHYPHEEELMQALKHRFDGLPIHKLCYYQSHYPLKTTIRKLEQAIANERRQRQTQRKQSTKHNCHDGCGGIFGTNQNLLQPPWAGIHRVPRLENFGTPHAIDSQQDAFGMTPLHILACSVHQSLDLYRLLFDYNPTDLITKDKWGDYPLQYAYQTHAPLEHVLLLLRSQQSIFPHHKIDWVSMIKKMCVNHASVESIQMIFRSHEIAFQEENEKEENRINLRMCIQDRYWFWKLVSFPVLQLLVQYQEANFPNETILWSPLVERLTTSPHWLKDLSMDKIVFVLKKGAAPRLAILELQAWKAEVIAKINSADISYHHHTFAEKRFFVKSVLTLLKHFELREMAALIELAMWKKELLKNHEQPRPTEEVVEDQQDLGWRQECLVSCGAEVVIANVLPLIAKSPSKLAMQRRSRSGKGTRGGRRRRRRIVDYVMNEI
ncbi:MAG: hypothetical protein SGBAC_001016 [Bacillariaceae sp.]